MSDHIEGLNRLQNEIGPLAWQGIYHYDTSEQFDDGDQTPLTGDRATDAKRLWAIPMDWHPNIEYLSPFTKCHLLGDYDGMMDLVGDKKGDELKRLLENGETYILQHFSIWFEGCLPAIVERAREDSKKVDGE